MDLLREKLRARGHHCPGVAAAVIGSAVVGGAISANSSKSASNAQVGAANRATDAQTGMFNQTVGMEAPFRQAGVDATSKLSRLLGIDSGGSAMGPLVDTSSGTPTMNKQLYDSNPAYRQAWDQAYNDHVASFGTGYTSSSDSNKIDEYLRSSLAGQLPSAASDPSFGSLLKPFSMDDFHLDPGIQFQTQQGNLALQNSQAAKNGVLSGGALKDLMAYNQGMAGTGYQSAFDRYMANKSFTLGSLMDMSKQGQAAAGNTVNAAGSFSSGIAGSMMGAGNASAAGIIGAGNALSGAATGAGNGYFLNSLLKNNSAAGGSPAGGVMSDDAIANYA